jgi:hypothetical protein
VPTQRVGLGVVQLWRQRAAGHQDLGSQFGLCRRRHASTMTASSQQSQNERN